MTEDRADCMAEPMFASKPLNIVVLAGGDSSERAVSLESGRCATQALRSRGHHVVMLEPAECEIAAAQEPEVDVFFPLVHGTGGEDGVLQRRLLRLQLPYVGSGVDASALTFNKAATRRQLDQSGIMLPAGAVVRRQTALSEVAGIAEKLGFPLVVKPASQGSSVGITIVQQTQQLPSAVELAGQYGDEIILEQFIDGREVTVPIVYGVAFPAIEIITARSWYDYAAKYEDDRNQYLVSPMDVSQALQQAALEACDLCGVSGISRVDFRVDRNGNPWLLEINTIPGMTSHSLVPMSAASLGMSLGAFCEQVCLEAIRRFAAARNAVAGREIPSENDTSWSLTDPATGGSGVRRSA